MKRTLDDWLLLLENIRTELTAYNPHDWIDLPPGRLIFKSNMCNKPGCLCAMDPNKLHGPYPYLQSIENGTQRQHYLNRREAKRIIPLLMERERYERLKLEETSLAQQIGLYRKTVSDVKSHQDQQKGASIHE